MYSITVAIVDKHLERWDMTTRLAIDFPNAKLPSIYPDHRRVGSIYLIRLLSLKRFLYRSQNEVICMNGTSYLHGEKTTNLLKKALSLS